VSRTKEISIIESCKREIILLTLVFSSLFSIKISPLLLVDIGTLPNHIKSYISWFLLVISFLFYLLAVDSLQSFHCRAVNSAFLCYMIADRSQQEDVWTHVLVGFKAPLPPFPYSSKVHPLIFGATSSPSAVSSKRKEMGKKEKKRIERWKIF